MDLRIKLSHEDRQEIN